MQAPRIALHKVKNLSCRRHFKLLSRPTNLQNGQITPSRKQNPILNVYPKLCFHATSIKCSKVEDYEIFDGKKIVFEKIGPEDFDAICPVAVDEFVLSEPMMLGIDASPKEFGPMLKEAIARWLQHGVSMCAREAESRKIVAVSISALIRRNDNHHSWSALRPTNVKTKIYAAMEKIMGTGVKVFDDPTVDLALEGSLMCIVPEYRDKGMATSMFKRTLDIGRQSGCQVFVAETSNVISENLCTKFGFETKFEYFYKDFKWEGRSVFDLTKMKNTIRSTIVILPIT